MSSEAKPVHIAVCSSNAGKLRDFSLAARGSRECAVFIEPLPELSRISPPEETGISFEQNAKNKAAYYSCFTSGLVLADDSGLEVAALNGAPGVHSARYAGPGATDEANNQLLLNNLSQVSQRNARFVCALALAQENKILLTVEGFVEGTILWAPEGSGGFGYDSLFFYLPLQRSFGELTPEEKLSVSHRGRALRLLFAQLPGIASALISCS